MEACKDGLTIEGIEAHEQLPGDGGRLVRAAEAVPVDAHAGLDPCQALRGLVRRCGMRMAFVVTPNVGAVGKGCALDVRDAEVRRENRRRGGRARLRRSLSAARRHTLLPSEACAPWRPTRRPS